MLPQSATNKNATFSLGKYSCTPAAPRMRRPPPSRATMSCTMPRHANTRKCARSTSAHSALLRSATLRAPLARSAARSAARYAHALCALCSAKCAALRSHSATQCFLAHACICHKYCAVCRQGSWCGREATRRRKCVNGHHGSLRLSGPRSRIRRARVAAMVQWEVNTNRHGQGGHCDRVIM